MADLKISQLTGATTPLAGTEVLPIVQSSTTKQVSVANLTTGRSVSATNFIPSGSTVPTNGLYLPSANTVGIAANSIQAVNIDSSQNIQIGTTSNPSGHRFVVEGSRSASFNSTQTNIGGLSSSCNSSNSDEPAIYAGNGNSGSSGVTTFYSSMGNGNGAQSNTSCFHLKAITQGSALYYLYGNGTSSFTSDARLKKNITTTRDGYAEDLCKLRVVKYNWNNAPEGEAQELGLIAQEVEQVFPGLVQDAVDEVQGIKPKVLKASVLPMMLLKAIQEQQAMIDSLKARLDAANL
jgi:hypothetical protein